MGQYIIALDQGTTSSRAIAFRKDLSLAGSSQLEFTQFYPKSGWVEHDPNEILITQKTVLNDLISKLKIKCKEVSAIGITNQRETTVIWDKNTGKPVYNAIVWQCRRTYSICENLKELGYASYIKERTGLVLDPYFSATKIKWILENVEGIKRKAENGDLLFGNIDSWLIWNLTNRELHITDYTNASRTMLFDINKLCWDSKILEILDIPACMLPEVKNSSEIYGNMFLDNFGEVPISGIAGDQQAALFGQTCFSPGDMKNTYGTGCFLLMNTGRKPIKSNNNLLTTIAIGIKDQIDYALEGSVFIGGASIQWLRDELKLIDDSKDSEYFALKVENTNGVYVVPAFSGLGTPYWDMYARGAIVGLSRGSNKNHIIRATLESIAYQSLDLINAMKSDADLETLEFKVDGGASMNYFLMQFQSDISGLEVLRPNITETTALGVAFLAGLAVGFWESKEEIKQKWELNKKFIPTISKSSREILYKNWKQAVKASRTFKI